MSLPDKHIAVWNLKDGPPIERAERPKDPRPAPVELDSRNQWEFNYFVYRVGDYFARYNQAVFDSAKHPHDPTYTQKVASVVDEYRAFVRSPAAPEDMDARGEGSQLAITGILISPQFDAQGLITGFQVEGIFPTGPSHPNENSSSSSSKRP